MGGGLDLFEGVFPVDHLVDLGDVLEELVAAQTCLAAGEEVRREFLPLAGEDLEVVLEVGGRLALGEFVGLGEDDGKGDGILAEPLDELEVNLLGFQAGVYEKEEQGHLFALQDVGGDHVLELLLLLLAAFGKAVARKVHEIPWAVGGTSREFALGGTVDEEVVDEDGLAWSGGSLGQLGIAREHVDEGTLSHVASAYEGIFGKGSVRALVHTGTGDEIFC